MKTKNTLRNNLTKLALFSMMTLSAEIFDMKLVNELVEKKGEVKTLEDFAASLKAGIEKYNNDLKGNKYLNLRTYLAGELRGLPGSILRITLWLSARLL